MERRARGDGERGGDYGWRGEEREKVTTNTSPGRVVG